MSTSAISRPQQFGSHSWSDRAGGILLVLGAMLYLYPYTGIRHDSIFYLGQALRAHLPQEFAHDLFFLYGSQADFTMFPTVMGWLLGFATPGTLFMTGTLVARLFFIAAGWTFIRIVIPKGLRFYALLALVCLPAGYGGFGMLRYGEPFLTARPMAEAMVLLGLAALASGRFALSASALAIAALFHPLQAIGGLGVAWIWLAIHDRRWWHVAWAALPLVALALADVGPFGRLAVQFDPAWYAPVVDLNGLVFPSEWNGRDAAYWLTDLYLLFQVSRCQVPKLSKLAFGSALCMAAGMAAALLFADLLRLVVPTGLQLWRAQWIGHLIAMIGLPALLLHEWRSEAGRERTALLAAVALTGAPTGFGTFPWAVLFLIPLHAAWPRLRAQVSPTTRNLVVYAMVLAMALHALRFAQTQTTIFRNFDYRTDLFRIDVVLAAHPIVICLLLYGAVRAWRASHGAWRICLLLSAGAFLAWSASRWDFRSEWSRYVESAPLDASLFGQPVAPGAQVYWSGQLLPTWLTLGRASYYNPGQQAGQLFNRETAIEATRRQARMAPLELQAAICEMMGQVKGNATACYINRFALETACGPAGATTPPDYLVLASKQPEPATGEWVIPDSSRSKDTAHYYLYRCADLMQARPSSRSQNDEHR